MEPFTFTVNEIQRTMVPPVTLLDYLAVTGCLSQSVASISHALTTSGRKSNVLSLETGVSYLSRSIGSLLLGHVNQVRCTRRSVNCGDEKRIL